MQIKEHVDRVGVETYSTADNKWKKVKLGDIAKLSNEKIPLSELSLYNYISTENMLQNKNGVCLSCGLPSSGMATRYLAKDILISNIRPYFKKIWFADKSGGASNDVLVIRAEKSSQKYLYYLLCSDAFFDYVMSGAKGTKMPRGDKFQIMEFPCDLPPLRMQRAIADVLGALDDKIEANRRQNKTLEAIAQALFKSWFVDFEPVKAKSEGKQPEGLAPEIADLFPSSFLDSPLGKIPEGWEVRRLEKLVFIVNGGTPSRKIETYWNGNIPWISIADFNKSPRYLCNTLQCITNRGIENSNTNMLRADDIIISARGTVGAITQLAFPMAFNQSCYGLRAKQYLRNNYLYYFLVNKMSSIKKDTHGSVFDTITKDNLNKIIIISPPISIQEKFDSVLADLHKKILFCEFQSQTLASIRDLLLPRLMGGKLEVSF